MLPLSSSVAADGNVVVAVASVLVGCDAPSRFCFCVKTELTMPCTCSFPQEDMVAVVIRSSAVRHIEMRSRHAYMMLESVDVSFVVIAFGVVASVVDFFQFVAFDVFDVVVAVTG